MVFAEKWRPWSLFRVQYELSVIVDSKRMIFTVLFEYSFWIFCRSSPTGTYHQIISYAYVSDFYHCWTKRYHPVCMGSYRFWVQANSMHSELIKVCCVGPYIKKHGSLSLSFYLCSIYMVYFKYRFSVNFYIFFSDVKNISWSLSTQVATLHQKPLLPPHQLGQAQSIGNYK